MRRYTFKELSRVALDFLATHHPGGELPVPIEEIAEFNLGLDIVPVPGLMSDLDVDAFITADLKEIRVDQYIQQKIPTRYRASLAHEVGHTLIHADFFKDFQFTTIAEWKTILASVPKSAVDQLDSGAAPWSPHPRPLLAIAGPVQPRRRQIARRNAGRETLGEGPGTLRRGLGQAV